MLNWVPVCSWVTLKKADNICSTQAIRGYILPVGSAEPGEDFRRMTENYSSLVACGIAEAMWVPGIYNTVYCTHCSTSCIERAADKPFQWITSRLDKFLFAGLCGCFLSDTHKYKSDTHTHTQLPLALVFLHVAVLVSRCVFQGEMMFLPWPTWESDLCNRIIWRGHSKLT